MKASDHQLYCMALRPMQTTLYLVDVLSHWLFSRRETNSQCGGTRLHIWRCNEKQEWSKIASTQLQHLKAWRTPHKQRIPTFAKRRCPHSHNFLTNRMITFEQLWPLFLCASPVWLLLAFLLLKPFLSSRFFLALDLSIFSLPASEQPCRQKPGHEDYDISMQNSTSNAPLMNKADRHWLTILPPRPIHLGTDYNFDVKYSGSWLKI